MKKILKSIFNYTTILSSFIGAIGYGIGYVLSERFNLHPIICIVCCLILGTIFDNIADTLLTKEIIATSKRNRIILAVFIYGSYFIAWIVVYRLLSYDLDIDFFSNIINIFIFQVISLIAHYIKRYIKKIKKKNLL